MQVSVQTKAAENPQRGNLLRPIQFPTDNQGIQATENSLRTDCQFIEMLDAYRPSGGLARLQELASRQRGLGAPDVNHLVGCISRRELICFEWQSHAWLPLFQFSALGAKPLVQLQPVLIELRCIYEPWELAQWFSRPHPLLADHVPADFLANDSESVLQAARLDSFAMN